MIGGNQGNNHRGNWNDLRVNPWERQDNDDIYFYTNTKMNYYGPQGRRNWLTSGSGWGRGGESNGSVNNRCSNICEPACELNPKEPLLWYNDIKIVKNDILNDFIDDSKADTAIISTINSEEYEREKERYSFEPLIYKVPTPKTSVTIHEGDIAH